MKRHLRKISHQNGADYIAEIQIGTRVYKGVGSTRLEAFKKARAVARALHGNFEGQKRLARQDREWGLHGREKVNRSKNSLRPWRKLNHMLYGGRYSRRPIKNPIPLAVWEAGVLATPYVIDAGHYGYKKYQEYKKHKGRKK